VISRDLFAREALALIPNILTLQDRNPHSPTYGCFDRNYWHYKIIDFPSGMSQEFVWPLALAYDTPIEGNDYYQAQVIRDWVEAGIRYAASSTHPEGSCDDYFPYERAAGAAAFSLLACIESYTLLGLDRPELLSFFEQRAQWLASHDESGRLSNHQALIVLCLERTGELLATNRWEQAKEHRLQRILDWQNEEGWFPEYEGFDPGYQTLTISCLARVLQKSPDHALLKDAIIKAVQATSHFVHPDGSFGGEYSSRNTYNFFPHGFELVGKWLPEALVINDRFAAGLAHGKGACYADDHIIGHHTWNFLLTWRDWVTERPSPPPRASGQVRFKKAGVLIDRRDDTELYLSLNKAGVFKCFRAGKLVMSDTQLSLQVRQGRKMRNAVGHLVGQYETDVQQDRIIIQGHLGWAKQIQMTTLKLIILRLVMFCFGRFFPNVIRRLLQRMMITGKSEAPYRFTRVLSWRDGRWHLRDELNAPSWQPVEKAGIGCDQTSIYVVMSRTYQAGQMTRWIDLTDKMKALKDGQALIIERTL
jgi:hypothetical protein